MSEALDLKQKRVDLEYLKSYDWYVVNTSDNAKETLRRFEAMFKDYVILAGRGGHDWNTKVSNIRQYIKSMEMVEQRLKITLDKKPQLDAIGYPVSVKSFEDKIANLADTIKRRFEDLLFSALAYTNPFYISLQLDSTLKTYNEGIEGAAVLTPYKISCMENTTQLLDELTSVSDDLLIRAEKEKKTHE